MRSSSMTTVQATVTGLPNNTLCGAATAIDITPPRPSNDSDLRSRHFCWKCTWNHLFCQSRDCACCRHKMSSFFPSTRPSHLICSVPQTLGVHPPFLALLQQEQMRSRFQTKPSWTTKTISTSALLCLLLSEGLLFSRTLHLFPIWPIPRLLLSPACILSIGLVRAHPILVRLSSSKPKGWWQLCDSPA